MKKMYQITLNHKQLQVLEEALNLYSRTGIGQLEILTDYIEHISNIPRWDIQKKWIDPMKKDLFGFENGASYGIAQENVENETKVAYDMQKTIQQLLAKVGKHHKYSVWHNGNILNLGQEQPITVEETDPDFEDV